MKERLWKAGTRIYYKFPILRPFMSFIHQRFLILPKFSGAGMQTAHELPWNDEYQGAIFRKANIDLRNNFKFTKDPHLINRNNLDEGLWRHYIISFAVRYVLEFANTDNWNFVECGVADGCTAFFALRELAGNKKTAKFLMHLYDSWAGVRKEELLDSELDSRLDHYGNLAFERTKENLAEFKNNIVYHPGFIPDSLKSLPESPDSIVYMHVDLNSAKPSFAALDYFFPRLAKGGVILFDDYGWEGYEDTKRIIDKFFYDKPGILMKIPTGQALYFR